MNVKVGAITFHFLYMPRRNSVILHNKRHMPKLNEAKPQIVINTNDTFYMSFIMIIVNGCFFSFFPMTNSSKEMVQITYL